MSHYSQFIEYRLRRDNAFQSYIAGLISAEEYLEIIDSIREPKLPTLDLVDLPAVLKQQAE